MAPESQCASSWCWGFFVAPHQCPEEWLHFIPSDLQHAQVLVGYKGLKHCNHCCSSCKLKGKGRKASGWQGSTLATALMYWASAEQQTMESAVILVKWHKTTSHMDLTLDIQKVSLVDSSQHDYTSAYREASTASARHGHCNGIRSRSTPRLHLKVQERTNQPTTLWNDYNNPKKQVQQPPMYRWEAQQKSFEVIRWCLWVF